MRRQQGLRPKKGSVPGVPIAQANLRCLPGVFFESFHAARMDLSMASYLIFGDLHGRVLPAFALARAWQRTYGEPVAGLLQVGDLGYFPDPTRLDRATKRHAQRDPMELGARQVIFESD